MKNYYKQGYRDGSQGISDWEREDMIDEIEMRDGIMAASDYEDGYNDCYEDNGDW